MSCFPFHRPLRLPGHISLSGVHFVPPCLLILKRPRAGMSLQGYSLWVFTRLYDVAFLGAFSISFSAAEKARSPTAGKLRSTAAIDSSYRVGVDQWAFEARPFEFELPRSLRWRPLAATALLF